MARRTGLACRAWGGIYAVSADWSEASSPVMFFSNQGWTPLGRQVADFSHSPRKALLAILRDDLRASGDPVDDEMIAAIVDSAWEL